MKDVIIKRENILSVADTDKDETLDVSMCKFSPISSDEDEDEVNIGISEVLGTLKQIIPDTVITFISW